MFLGVRPEEFDASFGEALPIIEEGEYRSAHMLPKARSTQSGCVYILRGGAC